MIQLHSVYQKALKTNKITKAEADLFFSDLYKETDSYIRENWKFYVNKGMWPLRARLKDKAQKDPVFILNHCTGAKTGKFEPALHRFFQAEKASANIIITSSGDLLYLVPLSDMAYHATRNSSALLGAAKSVALKVNDGKWLNEPGVEVVGAGSELYFEPIQFEAAIVLQRIMVAYFNNSVKMIKSHRFFSPESRAHDPGAWYFIQLVEHGIFNDVDISKNYWIQDFAKDKNAFAKSYRDQLKKYNLDPELDEWKSWRQQKVPG